MDAIRIVYDRFGAPASVWEHAWVICSEVFALQQGDVLLINVGSESLHDVTSIPSS